MLLHKNIKIVADITQNIWYNIINKNIGVMIMIKDKGIELNETLSKIERDDREKI